MSRLLALLVVLVITGCGGDDTEPEGCGEGVRQTVPGESFSYLPAATGLSIASSTAAAFFAAELLEDASVLDYLATPHPTDIVSIELRD